MVSGKIERLFTCVSFRHTEQAGEREDILAASGRSEAEAQDG